MEEDEEGAGVRKRKRHGAVPGGGSGEEEAGGGWCEKEMGEEYEGIAEESVEEVMRWLEAEISAAREEDGFVTINGNEESCGPSFSAAASTVMASVDTRAGAPSASTPAVPWPWPPAPGAEAAREEDEEEAAAAADVACELDEEWLVELLTAGPALEV